MDKANLFHIKVYKRDIWSDGTESEWRGHYESFSIALPTYDLALVFRIAQKIAKVEYPPKRRSDGTIHEEYQIGGIEYIEEIYIDDSYIFPKVKL